MLNHTLPSIEEFAAFLDGNLSQDEMQQFSKSAANDGTLNQLLNANSVVDETLNSLVGADLQLPFNLMGTDFELPSISSEEISTLASLSPKPIGDTLVAAYADDDFSMFSEVKQGDHTDEGEDTHDESSLTTLNNDSLDNNDDLSGSISNNIY